MQSSGPAIDKRFRDIGVVLEGLNEAEIPTLLRREAWQVVKLEMNEFDGVFKIAASVAAPVVDVVLALSAHCPDQLNDGVVKVEAHAHLGGPGADLVRLHLRDELFERARGESVTLV